MALVVYFKCVENLRESSDRMIEVTFRGLAQHSTVVRSKNHVAYFGQTFEWPIARPAEPEEAIHIEFVTYNKFMRNRVVGSYTMLLQYLVVHGQLQVSEPLIDSKNRPIKVSVTFEARYYSPDGRVGNWDKAEFQYSPTDGDASTQSSGTLNYLPACLEEVQSLRPSNDPTDWSLSQASGENDGSSDNWAGSDVVHNIYAVRQSRHSMSHLHKPRYMQVSVKIIEVQQLAGLNVDPVIRVQVGDNRKYSSIKQSTNSPYYDEYFVFEYNQSAATLFDKMITITASHALSIPGRQVLKAGNLVVGRDIGVFKCDIATVYAAPGHQFYHKWAVLLDTKDLNQGVKGYVKCDIAVLCKGDALKVPKSLREDDSNDIEGNLLLPAGMPLDRQRACYSVIIYRGEDLPCTDLGVVASMRQAVGLNPGALVDAYVRVSFVGQVGKTSVKKSYNPEWREVITFNDMFPPLCNRIKVQLCDRDPVVDDIIGTHFIDLAQIMDPGGDTEGILPTYGPNWMYFYGGTREYSVFSDELNDGVGQGCYYRGRLLLAIKTRILAEELATGPASVSTIPLKSALKIAVAPKRQFVLFATLFEATMIDKRFAGKPVHFEICIGNAGEVDDTDKEDDDENEDGLHSPLLREANTDLPSVRETTPQLPVRVGISSYYSIPVTPAKPCLYIFSAFEDLSRRLYHTNLLQTVAESFEVGLEEVSQLLRQESCQTSGHLRAMLGEFLDGCGKYLKLVDSLRMGIGSGKTKLDKYRFQMCKTSVERLKTTARELRDVTPLDVRSKFRRAKELLQRITYLAKEPQQSLPDVFVWLVCGGDRVAYHRVSANSIIHAPQPAFRGKDCGRLQSVFLKTPGKGRGQLDSVIQAKLNLHLWLGKHDAYRPCEQLLKGLPDGYEVVTDTDNQRAPLPPTEVIYKEHHTLQLRAYIFQARGLIGSDSTGLSDPFVRVIIGDACQTTQVIEETLSPTWDETLVFHDVIVYGDCESVLTHPPTVMLECFDYDFAGEPEFLGRVMVQPRVCLSDMPYAPPDWPSQLQWCDLQRGAEEAGQVLAAFELIEGKRESLEEASAPSEQTMLPVPQSIRPTLSRYRIEVLFWGLREPKRIQLLSVDRPRMEVQCGGQKLMSSQIRDFQQNSNFDRPVAYMDLDLPDNKALWPPITIRCVDCRKFGREVLLGTHTINHILKYFHEEGGTTDPRKASTTGLANERSSIATFNSVAASVTTALSPPSEQSQHDPPEPSLVQPPPEQPPLELPPLELPRIKQQLELIADLDWWSKFYVSRDDLLKAVETELLNDDTLDSDDLLSDTEGTQSDAVVIAVDYEGLDSGQLTELKQEANKEHLDSLSKKKRKKLLKKRTKEMLRKAKGLVNLGFFDDESLTEENTNAVDNSFISRLKIYLTELEKVPEFGGFKCHETFPLCRGKQNEEEEDAGLRTAGKFKGTMCIYRLSEESEVDTGEQISRTSPNLKLLKNLPNNKPFKVQVLIYVICATDLHPVDFNGKADPYIILQCGRIRINDKGNRQNNQLNPIFGKLFQLEAVFPMDSLLKLQVMDYDVISSDDLIGETFIDLENRYFSRHRATCGIQQNYQLFGYNTWRDAMKPSEILAGLCKELKLQPPLYSNNSCLIAGRRFYGNTFIERECGEMTQTNEHLALEALKHWHEIPLGSHLVPEHVETRTLYNSERPGIEQGKLLMWVDMFPLDKVMPMFTVDIKPRLPQAYELRCIIWNTDEVILEDTNVITGEASSDIFVRGYLKGIGEDHLNTDIHYRSLTGEGNFNWRFIFPFEYLKAEEKIVFKRKDGIFDLTATEVKSPAKLTLQVWDADIVSADDYLGAVMLDLNRIPKPVKNPKNCGLRMLANDGSVPTLNLFKNKRCRGWWPMFAKDSDQLELVGKVEAEFHLLTQEEASGCKVGIGREDPEGLPEPSRPDTSFLWFMNPLKTLKYVIWKNFKWKLLKLLIFVLIIAFIVLFFYSAPGATVNKIFGVK